MYKLLSHVLNITVIEAHEGSIFGMITQCRTLLSISSPYTLTETALRTCILNITSQVYCNILFHMIIATEYFTGLLQHNSSPVYCNIIVHKFIATE